jgi:transposase
LASSHKKWASDISRNLGCDDQTVRNIIKAFNRSGLESLKRGSSRPHTIHATLDSSKLERLRDILHQSPREFGKPRSLWTLNLAAEVSYEQGLTARQVSGEAIRQALTRLGLRWKRAKRWIESADPEYQRKKA